MESIVGRDTKNQGQNSYENLQVTELFVIVRGINAHTGHPVVTTVGIQMCCFFFSEFGRRQDFFLLTPLVF